MGLFHGTLVAARCEQLRKRLVRGYRALFVEQARPPERQALVRAR